MRYGSEDPVVLISSSFDLYDSRAAIAHRIDEGMQVRGSLLGPFRWEEETEGGSRLDIRSPVQRQIDDMLAGRIALTVVMFGERIGEAMRGEVPDLTRDLLDDWEKDGLVHPWPSGPEEQSRLLDEGKFPLTGTVYELLVGLHKGTPGDIIVGFVADREITPDTRPDGVMFNNQVLLNREAPRQRLSEENQAYVANRYRPQIHGLLNLLKALIVRRGLPVPRYDTAEAMVEKMAARAVELLEHDIPDRTGQLPFKSGMEHYRYGDPLPLPDRRNLRRDLKQKLLSYGKQGEMLVLEGPSGCGKSSLMQKGLLDELPFEAGRARVVVFRPTDLGARQERTPFLKVTGLIADTLERSGVSGLSEARSPSGIDARAKAANAASALQHALSAADALLVLAIDQFEDVVDLAELEVQRQDTAGSWWQVLRFLGAAVRQPTVYVVGTLENLRKGTIEALDFQTRAGLVLRAENADFPLGSVRDFVRETAAFAKLPLSRDLIDQIQKMVENFEASRRRDGDAPASASFLPLLGIWLHRLFATFQDRMGGSASDLSDTFGRTTDELTYDDLKERGIDTELAQLVGEMVQDAWEEAEQLVWYETGKRLDISDKAAVDAFVRSMFENEETAQFARAFQTPQGFDLGRFWKVLNDAGREVPGVALSPVVEWRPDEISMENFLNSLVSVEGHGTRKMRLTDMPDTSSVDSVARLIAAHRKRRLLVPAGPGRLRLVHQAVLDNWEPGRKWFAKAVDLLALVRRMDRIGEEVDSGYKSLEQYLEEEVDLVRHAVNVLSHKRGVWSIVGSDRLSERDERIRRTCLAIVAGVEDGALTVVEEGGSKTVAHEAARYDLAESLDRWLAADPALVDVSSTLSRSTLLHAASWEAGDSVRVLVGHGAKIAVPDADGWHPIAAPIQTGRIDIFDRLFGAYASGADVIGPRGITLLHEAARAKNPAFLRRMLESAADADVRDEDGGTPLHLAAVAGRIEQVRALLVRSDPTVVNNQGNTAIHLACQRDHGALISAFLEHEDLSDAHRAAILTGEGIEGVGALTPLALAAATARPDALAALLAYCDPSEPCHQPDGIHPVALVTGRNRKAEGGAPLADRVSECVRLLLADGRLKARDAARARGWAADFPDAQRQIDEWLIAREDFEDVPESNLLGWLAGPRPAAAVTVLTKVPGILDKVDGEGRSGATLLLSQGHRSTVAAALIHGVEPSRDPELFRLEAVLRLLKDGANLPDRLAVEPHPLVGRIVAGEAEDIKQVLLAMTPDTTGFRSLLHRLAVRDEIAAFHAILSELRAPVSPDAYGRPPSALAPPIRRAAFSAIEAQLDGVLQ